MKVAVIGSGPGAAVVALELLNSGIDVTVYEKGEKYTQSEIKPYSKEEMLFKYNGAGITTAFGNPKVKYVEGSCFGGGSEVNAGLYHRMPVDVINQWRNQYLIEDFCVESLESHFSTTAKSININLYKGELPKLSLKLKEGSEVLGWSCIEVPRWFQYTNDGGVRQSMTETYWAKIADKHSSLSVSLKTSVKSIRRSHFNKKWNIKTDEGAAIHFDAVFICAGAIETARLLRKSKLSKIAGKTLYMHPTIKIAARFKENINDGVPTIGVHQVKEFAPKFSFGCSISTPEFIALVLNENGVADETLANSFENFGIYYAMTSGGSGKVKNIPCFDESFVSYALDDVEISDIKEGVLRLAELLFAAGAIELYPAVSGCGKIKNLSEFKEVLDKSNRDKLSLMTIHLMGTCPFGENKKITVANSWGKVHGQDGLYIADSSLMCSALGVNPQGTVMALASRVVSKFVKDFQDV